MKRASAPLLCLTLLFFWLTGGAQSPGPIPAGSRVVIAPMGGFETFFAAAVREKKVPITLTLDKSSAQYFVVSTETEWQGFVYGSGSIGSWNRGGGSAWSGSSSSSTRGLEASIMLIDAKTKDVVWAYEVHKSSHGALLLGTLAARGKQSVAEACAKHLGEFMEKGNGKGTAAEIQAGPSPAPTPPSSVTIASTPAGAEIYLDDAFVGNTPSTVNVPSGKHSILVRKAGFADWNRDMIFSGGSINLSAELVQGPTSASTQAAKKEFTVTRVAQSGAAGGSSPGWIGVLTKGYLGQGVQVVAVAPGGPAAEGGLRVGDIIIQVNSISLHDGDFDGLIEERKPGTSVRIVYMRTYWAFETTLTVGRVPM